MSNSPEIPDSSRVVRELIPPDWDSGPYNVASELKRLLASVADHGTSIDSGTMDGQAHLWVTIGGTGFFITVEKALGRSKNNPLDASPSTAAEGGEAMTDITIPPEALEAAESAFCEAWDRDEPALLAFAIAMLKAWPGMVLHPGTYISPACVWLPVADGRMVWVTQEKPDAEV